MPFWKTSFDRLSKLWGKLLAPISLIIFLSFFLCACGGGSNSNTGGGGGSTGGGGGGGGGGGNNGISVSQLSPFSMMVGLPLGLVRVSGQGFSSQAQVLIDGQPASTISDGSTLLEAQLDQTFDDTVATHQFAVQDSGQVSKSLPFTVYAPQQGPFVMQAIPGFLVGENEENTPVIVAADVNGDGLADVIVPGQYVGNTESIAILYGQSNGTLSSAQYVPVPTVPYALAVGDVDGNGTPDIVSITFATGTSSTTVSVLFGDGKGNFQSPTTEQTFTGIFPGGAHLVDLDGDGKLDLLLLVTPQSGGVCHLVWLKNTGGAFGPPTKLANADGNNINNLAVADFNSDGKPDIVYQTNRSPETMHMLLNQGNGQFADQAVAGLNGLIGIANVIDFDLDGTPDLVLQVPGVSTDQLYSFKNDGNGSFTQVADLTIPGVGQLVAGDFDHDGFPDLAGPGPDDPAGMLYLFGDGHGNFTPQAVVGPEGQYAAVGDFNGDGIPDVVVPDDFSFVSLALGRTDRSFFSPGALFPATVTNLSTGDMTANGFPAIFVGGNPIPTTGIPGTLFENLGNGSFDLAAHTDPSTFMIADTTGKGIVDLLGGNSNLEIWPNNGTPNFSSSPITLPQPTANISIADMDGDGFPDVVSTTGQIFYGNGTYQFTPVTIANPGWGPYVIGDFNGDGKPDIATGIGTLMNTGNRTFQMVTSTNIPLSNGVIAVVGDFNGDGKDDIALNLPGDPAIGIYYSNGDGTFYQATELDAGQEPAAMVAGDFNGDGRVDLAVGLLSSEQVTMLFNTDSGQFTRSFFASGALAIAIVESDLNRNGKPDLVIGNFVFDFAQPNVNVVFHQ